MFIDAFSGSVRFLHARWYIISSWQKMRLKRLFRSATRRCSYFIALRGFLFFVFMFGFYLFSFLSLFVFASLSFVFFAFVLLFPFFAFLLSCFLARFPFVRWFSCLVLSFLSLVAYCLSYLITTTIIIIYNILISFVCVRVYTHIRARQRRGKIRHKNRAAKKPPYNVAVKIYLNIKAN